MKNRWYTNWLIVITVCLFLSSLGLFVISLKDSIGFTKCAYGDDLGENCVCTSDGEKLCDSEEKEGEGLESKEFTSEGLKYSYEFQDYIDAGNRVTSSIVFTDISYLGGALKISMDLKAFCNDESATGQQIGFYKLEKERLILTVSSNVSDDRFSIPCTTKSDFFISNFPKSVNEEFQITYQDEFNVLYPANNCVYEGYVRNEGDVYNSSNGCLLCQCKNGENSCETEPGCLE